MNIDSIKDIMDAFDPASLLPDLSSLAGTVAFICRLCVMSAPIVLLVLGLAYFFFAPKEANHHFGYRCLFGMGSVEAWRFTQRLAGMVLGGLGLVLTLVMLVITGSFAEMETMDVVWKAVKCLIWEGVLALISIAAINIITMIRFNYKGDYRQKKA